MQSEQIGNPLQALIALAVAKAAEIAAAKAAAAVAAVEGAVQGKIDQALGPVKDLASKADALGGGLSALGNGDLSAVGGVLAGASGLPGAGAMAAAMGGGGGGGGGNSGGSTASSEVGGAADKASALNIAAGNMLDSALGNAIQNAASKAVSGLDAAAGVDADGGGGSSDANEAGPDGSVNGVDATDRAKGPGHSTYKVSGSHSETVGAIKVLATLSGINTNIAGNMTQNAGAAIIQMSYGDTAEAVTGSKKEKELGLVVVAKGESEHVGGSKMSMIGRPRARQGRRQHVARVEREPDDGRRHAEDGRQRHAHAQVRLQRDRDHGLRCDDQVAHGHVHQRQDRSCPSLPARVAE